MSSPTPFLVFSTENNDDIDFLSGCKELDWSPYMFHYPVNNLSFKELSPLIGDRLDGLHLLSEALSHEKANGEYVELMRFFERAFKSKPHGFQKPLTDFLINDSDLGYSSRETNQWVGDVRTRLIHAYQKEIFFLEGNVRPIIARMRQAAFDVLFNKKIWRNRDSERRKGYEFKVASLDTELSIRITQGYEFISQHQVIDNLGKWPLHLNCILPRMSESWYSFDPKFKFGGSVKIVASKNAKSNVNQCNGITKSGDRCKRMIINNKFCKQHEEQ